MSSTLFTGHVTLEQAAERQMKIWAQGQTIQERFARLQNVEAAERTVQPYVAISRECGASGSLIAAGLARALGWENLDRELLERVAEKYNLSRDRIEFADERAYNLLHEFLGKWVDGKLVCQTEFVNRVGKVIVMAALDKSAIFVGRGAQFFLPHDKGVSVRVVAPHRQRVKRIMELKQLDHAHAVRHVDDVDRGRRDFVKHSFSHDIGDPCLYDLIINTGRTSTDEAVAMIADLAHRRFGVAVH